MTARNQFQRDRKQRCCIPICLAGECLFTYGQHTVTEPDPASRLAPCPVPWPLVCFGSWAQPGASTVSVWRGPCVRPRRGTSGRRLRVARCCAGTSVRAGAGRCTTQLLPAGTGTGNGAMPNRHHRNRLGRCRTPCRFAMRLRFRRCGTLCCPWTLRSTTGLRPARNGRTIRGASVPSRTRRCMSGNGCGRSRFSGTSA